MCQPARLRFVSLFVPDLAAATKRYEALLGIEPVPKAQSAPAHHPFAAAGPVVFPLGDVALALYQCDQQTTHPGDVGFGLEGDVAARARVIREQQGRVFWGPRATEAGQRLAIGMLPDRHFFELVDEPEDP